MSRAQTFMVSGYTGRDLWLGLVPERVAALVIAHKILGQQWRGAVLRHEAEPGDPRHILRMPGGAYEIVEVDTPSPTGLGLEVAARLVERFAPADQGADLARRLLSVATIRVRPCAPDPATLGIGL